ncbi:MAG: hypothetical protein H7196_00235 [candidate division SR1 bacterium]|nr:hypothetical protein [candidate division SR1 bacterium]
MISEDTLNEIGVENISIDESKLIPTIFINSKLFFKIRAGFHALASIKSKILFILLKDFRETQPEAFIQKDISSMTAHESSHIFTKYLRSNGVMQTNELDEDMRENFLTFLDEVICKVTGGDAPFGYTKLRESNSEYANFYKERDLEKYEEIRVIGNELNNLLYELGQKMVNKGIDYANLIGAIIRTQNFNDLKAAINEFDLSLNEIPDKASEVKVGWGMIGT